MNATEILKSIETARRVSQGENVEITLINPSDAVESAITENGGRVEGKEWVQFCHSDTCAHNSHDAGEERVTVSVPHNWIVQKDEYGGVKGEEELKATQLFEDADNLEIHLIIPASDNAIGIFERSNGRHFAPSTVARHAKNYGIE